MSVTARFEAQDTAAPAELKVVILYQDVPSGHRAQRLLRLIEEDADVPPELHVDLWRFDVLHLPQARRQAEQAVRQADIVILASPNEGLIPWEDFPWLCATLQEGGNGPASIILFGGDSGDAGISSIVSPACSKHLRALRLAK
jgi:hypothetical protein